MPVLRRPHQNFAIIFRVEKLELWGYQTVKMRMRLLVLIQYMNMTRHRQTDRQTNKQPEGRTDTTQWHKLYSA